MTVESLIQAIKIEEAHSRREVKGILISENAEFFLRRVYSQKIQGPFHISLFHDKEEMVENRDRDQLTLIGVPVFSSVFMKDNKVKFIYESN